MNKLRVGLALVFVASVGCTKFLGVSATSSDSLSTPNPTPAPTPPANQTIFYISPNGSNTLCTSDQPCSATTAQGRVRQLIADMQSDLTISLNNGTYELPAALTLSAADSGRNGHAVNIVASSGASPVISGGTRIQGWTLSDSAKNIWSASVPKGFDTRQFYVNGVRAERTKIYTTGATAAAVGFYVSGVPMGAWQNQKDIEVVSRREWKLYRCPVSTITSTGRGNEIHPSTGVGFGAAVSAGLTTFGGQTFSGDFNGDGKADLLFTYSDLANANTWHNSVALSNGGTFGSPSDWLPNTGKGSQYLIGDFNGDGKADLMLNHSVVLSNGSKFNAPIDWLPSATAGAKYLAGDFNGDGKTDLMLAYYDGANNWHNSVALSNGASFNAPTDWLTNSGQGSVYHVGDFNGDGKSDLLLVYLDGSGNVHDAVALSTGTGFSGATDWAMNPETHFYIGDFNGDGKSDLLGNNAVSISTGSSFNSPVDWIANQGSGAVGDFSGDHKADLFITLPENLVTVQNPCWTNSNKYEPAMKDGLNWIENAYELLNQPGQWYLNKSTNTIYYIPRAGENMATAVAVVPRLEQLIQGNGVSNLNISGITFAYAGWLEPNSAYGYAEIQAGHHIEAFDMKIPGHVTFAASNKINLTNNQFLHMGATAVIFDGGSQNILVQGNTFADISAGGIGLGDTYDQGQTDKDLQNAFFTVTQNYFTTTTLEYESAIPIFLGYTRDTIVKQNEIAGANYTGISLGWGWSPVVTYAGKNQITQNSIHDIMQTLNDGGGIYTLGAQAGSQVNSNFVENIGPQNSCSGGGFGYLGYVGLYHDAGSSGFYDSSNVIQKNCGYWLLLQNFWPDPNFDSYNNTLVNNYVDRDYAYCGFTSGNAASICQYNGNTISGLVPYGAFPPAAAQAIMSAAGVSANFGFVKNVRAGGFY